MFSELRFDLILLKMKGGTGGQWKTFQMHDLHLSEGVQVETFATESP